MLQQNAYREYVQNTHKPKPLTSKIRRFISKLNKEIHLDMSVGLGLILIVIALLTGYAASGLDFQEDENRRELMGVGASIGTVVGLLFAAKSLHNQYHYNLLEKASQYVRLWYDDKLSDSSGIARQIRKEEFNSVLKERFADRFQDKSLEEIDDNGFCPVLELKETSKTSCNFQEISALNEIQTKVLIRLLNHPNEQKAIHRLFSFFENMGQDVKLKVVDEDYLKDFFYMIVINYYEIFRKYIEYRQYKACNRGIWCNFVYLAQTWEKQFSPPEFPKICRRPWIFNHLG